MKQRDILDVIMETSVIVVKENTNQLEDSFGSTKKSKKILKNIRLGLDEYNTFMIEYMCKREGKSLPIKKEQIKENK